MKKKKELTELAKLMADIEPERLQQVFVKDKTLLIKLTGLDKSDVERMSKRFKLCSGDYLLQLHYLLREQLDNLNS